MYVCKWKIKIIDKNANKIQLKRSLLEHLVKTQLFAPIEHPVGTDKLIKTVNNKKGIKTTSIKWNKIKLNENFRVFVGFFACMFVCVCCLK